jgi:hypothetical protein
MNGREKQKSGWRSRRFETSVNCVALEMRMFIGQWSFKLHDNPAQF